MPIPAKILIADDHKLVRRTLRSLLARQQHWKVYEVADGKQAIDETRRLRPDVAVLDMVMPVMSGIEAAYEMRRLAPDTKIILMSSHYTPEEAAALARLFGDGNFIGNGQRPGAGNQPHSAGGIAGRLRRGTRRFLGHPEKRRILRPPGADSE